MKAFSKSLLMIPSPAVAPSSTDGLSTLHHPSSLHLVSTTHRTSLLTSSNSPISPKSPYKSLVNPSITQKPDENSNTTVSAPPEFSSESALGRQSPHVQSKRKRDSELHIVNGSQLREAQERVEQKRAKIAARVPSAMAPGNANVTPAPVTSLADLYAQMRRDSDASSQRDVTSVSTPSPTTAAPRNGRILHPLLQNNAPPRGTGRSTASSPDPIAMSEDDQEIVMLRHVRPSSPLVRPRLEPVTRLGHTPPHLNLKSLSQAAKSMTLTPKTLSQAIKPMALTPKGITTNGVDKPLDKARKAKPSFAVVVPSPPKRLTLKPTSVERNTPGRDVSQSKDSTPARTPVPNHTEKLKEMTNGKAPESPITHVPSSAPVRPTRSVESIPESIPDYAPRRLRRGMGASEDLTARDIDALLGAVPVPFDFSLSHRHLTTRDDDDDDGEMGDDESSLWWHHPIFEARARADIRRALGGALLPADPAQDPPPIASDSSGGSGWRAEVLPRQPAARMWAERLDDAFGPGPLDRGLGRKPRRVARPAGSAKRGAGEGSRSKNEAVRTGTMVIANSYMPAHRILEPPRQRSTSQLKSSNDTADAVPRPPASASLAFVEAAPETNISVGEAAAAWTAALLPLVKGKTTMDEARIAQTSDALGEVERANQRGGLARDVLKESALADTVRRLGELESVPLGDIHDLRPRARTLTHRWREAFGDDVVDLQREVLLHLPKQ